MNWNHIIMILLAVFLGILVPSTARTICNSVNVSTIVMTDQRVVTDKISIVLSISSNSTLTISNFYQWHANASAMPFPRPVYNAGWSSTDLDLSQTVYPNFHEGPGEVWFYNYYTSSITDIEQLGFPVPLPLIGNSFYWYNGQSFSNTMLSANYTQPGVSVSVSSATPIALSQTVTCLNLVDIGVSVSGSALNCNSFTGVSDFSINGVSKASMQVDYTFVNNVITGTVSKATIIQTDWDSEFLIFANINPFQNDYFNRVPQMIPGCWGLLKGCSFYFDVTEYAGNIDNFAYLFAVIYSKSKDYFAINAKLVHSNGMWIVDNNQVFSTNNKCFTHSDVSGGVLSNSTFCCTNFAGTEGTTMTNTGTQPTTLKSQASVSNAFNSIFIIVITFLAFKIYNHFTIFIIFACMVTSSFAVPVCTDVSVTMTIVDITNQTTDSFSMNLQLNQIIPSSYNLIINNFSQSHKNSVMNFTIPKYMVFGVETFEFSNNKTFGGLIDGPGYLYFTSTGNNQGQKKNLKEIFKKSQNKEITTRSIWTIPLPIANGGFYKVTGDVFTQTNGCYQSSSFDQEYYYSICCTNYKEEVVIHQNDKIDCQEFQSVTAFGSDVAMAQITYQIQNTQIIATMIKGYQLIYDYSTFYVFNINYDMIAQQVSGFGPFSACVTTGKGCRLITDIDKNNDVILQHYVAFWYKADYGNVAGRLVRRGGTWLTNQNQVFTMSNPCYEVSSPAGPNIQATSKFCCTKLTNGTILE